MFKELEPAFMMMVVNVLELNLELDRKFPHR